MHVPITISKDVYIGMKDFIIKNIPISLYEWLNHQKILIIREIIHYVERNILNEFCDYIQQL